ncbi:MAG: TetR/AcrR family transcriptional regulator [Ignavibacteria bacterium]|nr:TetR/AcrR family transcriptional regulator [Ignavibacteria bacterium]
MDKIRKDIQTEKRILESARKIFHKKGFSGARMQEIANEAGINKAMLHYYFRSKQKLFDAIFIEGVEKIFPKIKELLNKEMPLFDKIRFFVKSYISLLQENYYLPGFVINELNQNPSLLTELINKNRFSILEKFNTDIKEAKKNNLIENIDFEMLVANIISLCIFPILAKPFIVNILGLNEEEYLEFIEKRKTEVAEFIIKAIKK